MIRTLRAGRVAAALAIAAAGLVMAPSPASAHAGIESSSPANGARLHSAPRTVTLTFEEHVALAGRGTRIVDGEGRAVPSKAVARGDKVTITPTAPLPMGRYAATWKVLSHDGDVVTGAISFTVHQANPAGPPVRIASKPAVPTTLSAALPGSLTLSMTTKARVGDIEWTSALIRGPIVWEFEGDGSSGTATGVLPTAGTWTFEATLVMANDAIVVVSGSVLLNG